MSALIPRRQILLSLLVAPVVPILGACGEKNDVSVLPDQGAIKKPEDHKNELKPKKGMDRNGS